MKQPRGIAAGLFLWRKYLQQHDAGIGTCLDGSFIPNARLHLADVRATQKEHTQPRLPDAAADGERQFAI